MTLRVRLFMVAVLCCTAWSVGLAETPAPVRTPREALGLLKVGNDRFIRNASAPVSLSAGTREELAKGQRPWAMVLSCADSRVPPEHIFNVGLGELFVIRTAGQVMDKSILASLESGAEHLHIPLMVVMGHESCDAVHAATTHKGEPLGPNLDYVVKAIKVGTSRTPAERTELRTAILANVEQVINDALTGSTVLRRLVDTQKLLVVGGYYELASGRVMFSEPASSGPAPKTAPAPKPPAPVRGPVAAREPAPAPAGN
ncbi:MAG: carbonic anhydrase [Acidimicrobiia bacterium]|nr:carbonic anhydrase [Acidimicrobiia bacterium]